jgi:hypothetical protein
MRLNAVPPGSVTAPEVRGEVGSVAAARAIGSQGAGATLATPQGPAEAPAPAPAPAVERRRVERRVDERRKQKLPVLLDMRGRPRRKARRRTDDETPSSIDTKA